MPESLAHDASALSGRRSEALPYRFRAVYGVDRFLSVEHAVQENEPHFLADVLQAGRDLERDSDAEAHRRDGIRSLGLDASHFAQVYIRQALHP